MLYLARAAFAGIQSSKWSGPAAVVVEPLLPGRGRDPIVALPLVNAVFANDVR
jgi:hypothetical protein